MNVSDAISLYLAHKRALGHRFLTEENVLFAFHNTVGDRPVNGIEDSHVLAFLNGNGGPVTEYWVKKCHVLSGFYRFALSRGLVTQSPLPRLPQLVWSVLFQLRRPYSTHFLSPSCRSTTSKQTEEERASRALVPPLSLSTRHTPALVSRADVSSASNCLPDWLRTRIAILCC